MIKTEIKIDTTARIRHWLSVDDIQLQSTVLLSTMLGDRDKLINHLRDCAYSACRDQIEGMKIYYDFGEGDIVNIEQMADDLIQEAADLKEEEAEMAEEDAMDAAKRAEDPADRLMDAAGER